MARVFYSDGLQLEARDKDELHFLYNGLDCCLTLEILSALLQNQTKFSTLIYNFERALQAPALEMMLRGFLIDNIYKHDAISTLSQSAERLQRNLDKLAYAVWDKPLNPNSPKQMKEFFYESMGLKPVFKFAKGKRTVTTNRQAIEQLSSYLHARPFCSHVLALRDTLKLISTLRTGVDPDHRIRASYNVAGTETGRWSSSENAFGTGTNLQNITPSLRQLFIADPGMKLAYCDLEQAESRVVGMICYALFNDERYISACEAGDLHTAVTRMVWTKLPWTENQKENRAIADQKFYREFSYRDMAKRAGHGTNYRGQAPTIAKNLNVEQAIVAEFQQAYFTAFPAIKSWHLNVAQQLQTQGQLTTFLGRQRHFFSRLTDDATLREAIAFEPQSIVGDVMNEAIRRLHNAPNVQLLAQIHDAVVFQYPEHLELPVLTSAYKLLQVPLTIRDKTFTIPIELSSGWNWGKREETKDGRIINPDGLKKFKFSSPDTRTRLVSHDTPLLHRPIW